MVTSTKSSAIQLREINGQVREIGQTKTARICSRARSIAELDYLLLDSPEHDSPDDLRDLDERIGC